jgi:hypothetical protein
MAQKDLGKEPHPTWDVSFDPDGLAYALEVARGMASATLERREAAEKIWLAIADGEASDGTKITWINYVAKRLKQDLLKNDNLDDRRRGSAALNAIGLSYRKGEGHEIREFVSSFLDLQDLTRPEIETPELPKPMQLVRLLRDRGFLNDCDDRPAQQRVRRVLRKELESRKGK